MVGTVITISILTMVCILGTDRKVTIVSSMAISTVSIISTISIVSRIEMLHNNDRI